MITTTVGGGTFRCEVSAPRLTLENVYRLGEIMELFLPLIEQPVIVREPITARAGANGRRYEGQIMCQADTGVHVTAEACCQAERIVMIVTFPTWPKIDRLSEVVTLSAERLRATWYTWEWQWMPQASNEYRL